MILRFATAAILLAFCAPALLAQGVGISAGHLFAHDGWNSFRFGATPGSMHPWPFGLEMQGVYITGPSGSDARLYGLGAGGSFFRGGSPGIYLTGSVEGGLGTVPAPAGEASRQDAWWGWSAGIGYELRPLSFISLGVEGRWREISVLSPKRGGIELGFRIGFGGGSGSVGRPTAPAPGGAGAVRWWSYGSADPVGERPGAPLPLATASRGGSVRQNVVETAMAALGTRYQWGGEGEGDDGFDCSGLIQYAFGEQGISLPRTSAEQAHAGREVPRKLAALAPGDLLTFAKSGTRVTHVGLYLGDGRFIHSATGGVQVSRLSPDDPYGRWWWKRWVGARRIIE